MNIKTAAELGAAITDGAADLTELWIGITGKQQPPGDYFAAGFVEGARVVYEQV